MPFFLRNIVASDFPKWQPLGWYIVAHDAKPSVNEYLLIIRNDSTGEEPDETLAQ